MKNEGIQRNATRGAWSSISFATRSMGPICARDEGTTSGSMKFPIVKVRWSLMVCVRGSDDEPATLLLELIAFCLLLEPTSMLFIMMGACEKSPPYLCRWSPERALVHRNWLECEALQQGLQKSMKHHMLIKMTGFIRQNLHDRQGRDTRHIMYSICLENQSMVPHCHYMYNYVKF